MTLYGSMSKKKVGKLVENNLVYMTKSNYLAFPGIKQYIPIVWWNPIYSLAVDTNVSEEGTIQNIMIFRKSKSSSDYTEKTLDELVLVSYKVHTQTGHSGLGEDFKYRTIRVQPGFMNIFVNCFYEGEGNFRIYCFVNYIEGESYIFKLRRQKI
jgi:hypothetical protein